MRTLTAYITEATRRRSSQGRFNDPKPHESDRRRRCESSSSGEWTPSAPSRNGWCRHSISAAVIRAYHETRYCATRRNIQRCLRYGSYSPRWCSTSNGSTNEGVRAAGRRREQRGESVHPQSFLSGVPRGEWKPCEGEFGGGTESEPPHGTSDREYCNPPPWSEPCHHTPSNGVNEQETRPGGCACPACMMIPALRRNVAPGEGETNAECTSRRSKEG